ncbi:MAG: SAM-dependent methyltransferase [Xanthomonadaceae bacterium]|nr:SAM-dependent methyltransferase [Xanthomonadaceae bacterium]
MLSEPAAPADPGNARREHWQRAWTSKPATATSWYQLLPTVSLELIAAATDERSLPLIDIGGGASTLVDALLDAGWQDLSVLDISAAALAVARERLGAAAASVRWLEIDLLDATLLREYAIWHDRAVFHFLTDPVDRERYRQLAEASVRPGGQLIIGSFAEDGPLQCSGLPVQRHSALTIAAALGDAFELLETRRETHLTPSGNAQHFVYCRFVHRGTYP